jgi:hypothetical protein
VKLVRTVLQEQVPGWRERFPAPERLTLKSKKPETLEKAGDFGPVA